MRPDLRSAAAAGTDAAGGSRCAAEAPPADAAARRMPTDPAAGLPGLMVPPGGGR